MNKYNDLELCILSCLLQRPELMGQVTLEDKHFIKQKKIWLFMKSFYNKFHNFDLVLMTSICKDKYRIVEYISWLIDKEPAPSRFNEYQKQLIDLYNETKKEKWIIEEVYKAANDLFVRNITLTQFNERITEIYKNADEIFKEVD